MATLGDCFKIVRGMNLIWGNVLRQIFQLETARQAAAEASVFCTKIKYSLWRRRLLLRIELFDCTFNPWVVWGVATTIYALASEPHDAFDRLIRDKLALHFSSMTVKWATRHPWKQGSISLTIWRRLVMATIDVFNGDFDCTMPGWLSFFFYQFKSLRTKSQINKF